MRGFSLDEVSRLCYKLALYIPKDVLPNLFNTLGDMLVCQIITLSCFMLSLFIDGG